MDLLLDFIIVGVSIGIVYGLVALGISLIFSGLDIVHFAHGEVYMIGAFIGIAIVSISGVPYFGALVGAMVVTGVLGVVIERVFYRRLTRGGGGYTVAGMGMIICGFGMSVALQNVAYLIWGAAPHPYPVSFGMPIFLGNIALPKSYLYILVSAVILMAVLHTFLTRTKLGLAVRAVAYDKDTSYLMGVNVPAIDLAHLRGGVRDGRGADRPHQLRTDRDGIPDAAEGIRRRRGRRIREPPGSVAQRGRGGAFRDVVRRLPDCKLQGHLRVHATDRRLDGAAYRPSGNHLQGQGIAEIHWNLGCRAGVPCHWPVCPETPRRRYPKGRKST